MATYEEIIKQFQEQIDAKGKFSLKNLADSILGVADINKDELQALLNKFLDKKGQVSAEDQAQINAILEKQKQEKKVRRRIVIRNAMVAVGLVATGTVFYFTVKHKKK